MTYVTSIATELPPFRTDNSEILEAVKSWLSCMPDQFQIFTRFLESTQTKNRHFAIPLADIISQNSLASRAKLFEELAPALASAALAKAIEQARLDRDAIDAIIFTSCTCPIIPALDTYLIDALELPRNIFRIPLYQSGCAGGVFGLGLSKSISHTFKNIALVSTELCSLVFQPTNTSTSHLIAAALFGDGAGAAIISSKHTAGLEIIEHQSFLIPNSRHLMGYDILDTGSHLRLDRELPSRLLEYVPNMVDAFLSRQKISRSEIAWWLFHPGSYKILTSLEYALQLKCEQTHWSLDTLRALGNMSSATIFFVIQEFMLSNSPAKGDLVVILGIGPGLTLEIILGKT